MRECSNCQYYGTILDESDQPRYGCRNVQSSYYYSWVCADFYCSRYKASDILARSCSTCVHEICHTQADKDACLDCFGWITGFSEYEPVACEEDLYV